MMRSTAAGCVEVRLPCRRARGWERLRGLIGRPAPPPGTALHFPACLAVHTFGMGYAIDVVFLDRRGRVLRVVPAVPPGRALLCWRAWGVLELRAGEAGRLGLARGVRVGVVDSEAGVPMDPKKRPPP